MKLLVLVEVGATVTILVVYHCLLLVMSHPSPYVAAQRVGDSDSNNLVSSGKGCLGPPSSLSAYPERKTARWLGRIWSSGRPGNNITVPDCSSSFLQPLCRKLWWQGNRASYNNTTASGGGGGDSSRWPLSNNWKQQLNFNIGLIAGKFKTPITYCSPWVMKNMVLASNVPLMATSITTMPSQITKKRGLSRGQQLRDEREPPPTRRRNNKGRVRRDNNNGDIAAHSSLSSKMPKFFELPSWIPTKLVDLEEIERKVKTSYWKKRHAISLQLKPNLKLKIWNQVPEGEVCERAEAGSMVHEWRLVKEFHDRGDKKKNRFSTESILLQNDYTVTTSAGGKGWLVHIHIHVNLCDDSGNDGLLLLPIPSST